MSCSTCLLHFFQLMEFFCCFSFFIYCQLPSITVVKWADIEVVKINKEKNKNKPSFPGNLEKRSWRTKIAFSALPPPTTVPKAFDEKPQQLTCFKIGQFLDYSFHLLQRSVCWLKPRWMVLEGMGKDTISKNNCDK